MSNTVAQIIGFILLFAALGLITGTLKEMLAFALVWPFIFTIAIWTWLKFGPWVLAVIPVGAFFIAAWLAFYLQAERAISILKSDAASLDRAGNHVAAENKRRTVEMMTENRWKT